MILEYRQHLGLQVVFSSYGLNMDHCTKGRGTFDLGVCGKGQPKASYRPCGVIESGEFSFEIHIYLTLHFYDGLHFCTPALLQFEFQRAMGLWIERQGQASLFKEAFGWV